MGLCLREWRVLSLGIIFTSVSDIPFESQWKGPLFFPSYFKGFCTIYEIMCVRVCICVYTPSACALGSLNEPSTFIFHASEVTRKPQKYLLVSSLHKVRIIERRKKKVGGMVTHTFNSSNLGRSLRVLGQSGLHSEFQAKQNHLEIHFLSKAKQNNQLIKQATNKSKEDRSGLAGVCRTLPDWLVTWLLGSEF